MNIVFFGSSKYSCVAAKILNQKLGISLVITNPDKPSGRKRKLAPSPVKEFALQNKIPVLTFDILDEKAINEITKINIDFLVVADFGKILPDQFLASPKYAALNIHHSLLPKYRGPSPAPAAILAGEKKSGVTVIKMTKDVDAGSILAQEEYKLKEKETTDSLLIKLNTLGAKLLIDVIKNYLEGTIKPQKQNEKEATNTHRFKKEDGRIDLENPPDPQTFNRMIRAFYPWPGTWCQLTVHGRQFTVKFLPVRGKKPGIKDQRPFLVQPESKRPMTIREFLNGYPETKELINKLLNGSNLS